MKARLAGGLILLLATFAAYSPALRAGFVWDDDDYVENNAALRTLDGLRRIWFEPGAVAQYYPLTYTSFWIEYQLWGLNPAGYHVVNILLHGVNALLFWRVLRRIGMPGAWIAAALFALHPVHVESVAWITERKNLLAGAFYLLSALAFVRFVGLDGAAEPGRRARGYVASLAAFVAALLSKTASCTLPGALLLLVYWKRADSMSRRDWVRTIALLIPFFVIGVLAGLGTIVMERSHVGAEGEEWSRPPLERALLAGRIVWFYAATLVWPRNLSFVYREWPVRADDWFAWAYPISVVAVIAALWLGRRRWGRGPLVAALYFVGTLFPVLGFFNIYYMRYAPAADHFQYLPSMGLIAALVAASHHIASRRGIAGRRAAAIAAAAVLCVCGAMTSRQSQVYHDRLSLWTHTVRLNPDGWLPNSHLGYELLQRDRAAEAIEYLETAVRRRPQDASIRQTLSTAYVRLGRTDDAIGILRDGVAAYPEDARLRFYLGFMLAWVNEDEAAIAAYREAIALDDAFVEARNNLATLLLRYNRAAEAIDVLAPAIRARSQVYELHQQLGSALWQAGRRDEAIDAYRAAAKLRPDDHEIHRVLADCLVALGRHAEAIDEFRERVRLRRDDAEAIRMLAWLWATSPDAQLRNGAAAMTAAKRLIELSGPDNPAALDVLAAAAAESGDFTQAVEVGERVCEAAKKLGKKELVDAVEARLALYRAGRPYRDPLLGGATTKAADPDAGSSSRPAADGQ